jgi:alkanesulfonate monooxygenase SsuD/methylene tetrahydromethanopterin reductase-like flavin-dependent oxidoreductase (luciferase family)
MQFHLFLPQMRLPFERLVAIARAAEAAGFNGIVGMDHLEPPGAEDQPMYEAMVANTWIAAHTQKLAVGSLVLCDALRHPALLARQAVSIDHASGGRFELGIGWGSWPADFEKFGVTPDQPRDRVARLRETLEIIKALWAGEKVTYEGAFHRLRDVVLAPRPLGKIPVLIGGSGPKTLALVREFADWWNLDIRHLDKLGTEAFDDLRAQVGKARVSIQQMVAYVPDEAQRQAITDGAMRRFGYSKPTIGAGPELLDHFANLNQRGVERAYVWFCDFAPPETVAAFGEAVIRPLQARP